MSKENAIELLKNNGCFCGPNHISQTPETSWVVEARIYDKILAELEEQPVCKTCGGSGQIPANEDRNSGHIPDKDVIAVIPCPDCPKPEPTSDAVKILCKRYGTSVAKIAMDLEAENERLKMAAKKVIMCFPDEIPEGQEEVSFNIPAYIIKELAQILDGKRIKKQVANKDKEDVFEIRIPNLRREEIPIARKAINEFTKQLLNTLMLRRSQKRN